MEEEIKVLTDKFEKLKAMVAQTQATGAASSTLVPQPRPIDLKNPDLQLFKYSWENYVIAAQLYTRKEEERAAILLTAIGDDCFRVIQNLKLTEEKKKSCKEILAALENNLAPEQNVIYSRVKFNEARQTQEESAELYIDRLRGLIKPCKYSDMEDELLRDRLVVSIKYNELKTRFMSDSGLTLEKVIKDIKAFEAAQTQLKAIRKVESQETEVNKMKARGRKDLYFDSRGNTRDRTRAYSNNNRSVERNTNRSNENTCRYCGYTHKLGQKYCPANKRRCIKCNKENHFARVCRSSYKNNNRNVNVIQRSQNEEEIDTYEQLLEMEDKYNAGRKRKKIFTKLCCVMDDSRILWMKCQIDTGAMINVIGYNNLCKIIPEKTKMYKSDVQIKTFGDYTVKTMGKCILKILNDEGNIYNLEMHVVEFDHVPMIDLKLIKVNSEVFSIDKNCQINIDKNKTARELIAEYKDVFTGIGKLDRSIKLNIRKDAKPCIETPRRIPLAYRKQLKSMLDDLQKDDIIAKVDEHTPWVSNLLIVKQKDKMRLCLDPVKLNQALDREKYQMQTLDEILPELKDAKIFSTFDARKGFWQLTLDDESSKLTTFWTPFGRYRWKRMPFGIAPAPEIFQKMIHEIILDLPNVEAIADDILVYGKGKTEEEAVKNHNECLQKLLFRLRKVNLKINPEKMNLSKKSVKYFGHILTGDGLKPDISKVDAIEKMNIPKNKKELTIFLGMITYLSRFIPNLSQISKPLRDIVNKDAEFCWNKKLDDTFIKLKGSIKKATTLAYFDVDKQTVIQCDASEYGLGGVLMQEGKPIIFASRTLTSAERRYSQIEKEALAIYFACTRFKQYISGQRILIHSDHKPLEIIWKKPIIKAPRRLQRILINLAPYDIDIVHIPGKEMFISDALSRFPINDSYEDCKINDQYVYEVDIDQIEEIEISEQTMRELKKATEEDDMMKKLKDYILKGWPENKKWIKEKELRIFFTFRDTLSVQDELIIKEDRIVVPIAIQEKVIKKLHRAHLGQNYTLQFARRTVFWPKMTEMIRKVCRNCDICRKYEDESKKLPMQSVEIANYPGEIYSMDIFEYKSEVERENYLLIVDHYSDFFEIRKLMNMKSNTIMSIMKETFARYGAPRKLICDNAKQFISFEIKKFAEKWKFEIACSDPIHPQGNGKAEATVKIAKQLLIKAKEAHEDFYIMLLQARNTPNNTRMSPAERMFCRTTRVPDIPIIRRKLYNTLGKCVKEQLNMNKRKSKKWYDRKTAYLPKLKIGSPVYVRLKKNEERREGTITDQIKDRSYIIETERGEIRRNRTDIVPRTDLYNRWKEKEVKVKKKVTFEDEKDNDRNIVTRLYNQTSNEDNNPQGGNEKEQRMETPTRTTRSGRITRIPKRLQDYQLY